MPETPIKAGIIGCGNISDTYFKVAKRLGVLEITACADGLAERAAQKAALYGGRACAVPDLLADPEIEMVINLTPPMAHANVAKQVLMAGKSVYNEKPLSAFREQARELLALAAERGLRVGSAPDTFMGAGLQTCRKAIDDGLIGKPVAATAFMLGRGPEAWHPDPEFFYKVGGGPMFDIGPYYLTALVSLVGPVKRVSGSAQISIPERVVGSGAKKGQAITVETPTHIAGTLDFAQGMVATVIMSFDVWKASLPRIEIYGTEGTLSVPDPNTFGGPVRAWCAGDSEWRELPLVPGEAENSRGLGPADLALAQRAGRAQRASGEMAYHVLDMMHAFHDASREGRSIELESTCTRPEPFSIAEFM